MTDLNKETFAFLTKIIFPAFIISVIGLAVEIKQGKAKFWNSFLSIFISVGSAYIASDYILATVQEKYIVLVVALVVLTSDKILGWIIFKFNIDLFLTNLSNSILEYLKNKIK